MLDFPRWKQLWLWLVTLVACVAALPSILLRALSATVLRSLSSCCSAHFCSRSSLPCAAFAGRAVLIDDMRVDDRIRFKEATNERPESTVRVR